MIRRFDCIVIGLGGFGSAALLHAADRGLKALGIEQFEIGHARGSSHGETRIIRKAYFEHPDYVPLLMRAYELWRRLEADVDAKLMRLCGLLLAGPPAGEAIAGARLAARLHRIALESIDAQEAAKRFAGFRIPDGFDVVFEPEAGYLDVEACVRAHVRAATQRGATVAAGETVVGWQPTAAGVRVRTSHGEYESASLIVTAGPWAGGLLHDLGLPLEVVRKPQFWFPCRSNVYDVDRGAPAYYFEMPFGHFYGFPSIEPADSTQRSLKAAEHSGGTAVADPHRVDREAYPTDLDGLTRFIGACLPDVDPIPVRHSVCLYTLSPDRHFIVDRHPEHGQVAMGCGFSGHGFKFTPVIGEALVDLATEGRTSHPIEFLSARREAITATRHPAQGAARRHG